MAVKPTKQQLENRDIAAAGGTPVETFDSNAFISAAASRLLSTSGIISSEDTALESKITTIQAGIEKGLEASTERIESSFGREIEFQTGQFAQQRTTEIESQRGFARNTSALRLLDEKTEKSLRDLEQRKQELILAGEAAASEQITNLQIKEIEFQQQARQRFFTNLLALSQFGLQAKQEERLGRQQSFVERSAIASIGLEFGLEVSEGTTLESIIALAAPRANTRRKAELAKLIADTNRQKAETAKALRGEQFALDSVSAAGFASTLNSLAMSTDVTALGSIELMLKGIEEQHGVAGLNLVKAAQLADVEERFTDRNLRKEIKEDIDNGESRGDIVGAIEDNVIMSEEQKKRANKIVEELIPTKTTSFFDPQSVFGQFIERQKKIRSEAGVGEGIFGIRQEK